MRKTAVLANMVCVLMWGFSFISLKVAVPVIPPMTLGAVRFAIAALILAIPCRLMSGEKPRVRDLPCLAGSGFAGVTLYFWGENNGVALITASEASIITAAIPVLTMTAEWFAARLFPGGEAPRLGWRRWLGALISAAGVGLVARVSLALSGNITGYLYMGGAALCWVAYGFLTKPLFDRGRSQIYIVFWQNCFGLLGFLPFAAMEHSRWTPPSLPVAGHVLFLAVCCSALGYWLYAHALKGLGVSAAAAFINLIPVVTVIAGFCVLKERLSPLQWAGAALAMAGVYLAVLPQRRVSPSPLPPGNDPPPPEKAGRRG
ncbi:MAG: DMT family transporter [Treponema sp.]|jgi:drug/metabolite transporter (DMT)-like permease|nr:DMT family transporter [Treponema sp.]